MPNCTGRSTVEGLLDMSFVLKWNCDEIKIRPASESNGISAHSSDCSGNCFVTVSLSIYGGKAYVGVTLTNVKFVPTVLVTV